MKSLIAIIVLLLSLGNVYSQNTNSPYSILGIGDIETNYYNRTSGLANTGLAYRNDKYTVNNNPASYTALPLRFFSFEVSGRAQFVSYKGTPLNGSSADGKDFAIKRLAVATKINKWWGSSGGLMPYSTASYSFSSQKNIQGTGSTVPVTYDGTGGVNQVYWDNAFEPIKHLSIGVHAAYLFGSLTQTESLVTEGLSTTLTTTRQTFLKNFNFTYGAQYYTPINKRWDISLGGIYQPKHNLSAYSTVVVTDNGTQISSTQDVSKSVDFNLPEAYGFGFSLTKDKKYSLVGDYKFQGWSSTNNFNGSNYSLQNSSRASLGFEVSNKLKNFTGDFEKNFIQAGVYYGNSYLRINGQQLQEMGLTLGYGLFRNKSQYGMTGLGVSLGLDVGQRGTTANGLIKENYVNFTITVSYRDFWRPRGIKYL
ncbi:MAG: hypothetical protein QM726_18490 [Chitinophagaceae bacterium]